MLFNNFTLTKYVGKNSVGVVFNYSQQRGIRFGLYTVKTSYTFIKAFIQIFTKSYMYLGISLGQPISVRDYYFCSFTY